MATLPLASEIIKITAPLIKQFLRRIPKEKAAAKLVQVKPRILQAQENLLDYEDVHVIRMLLYWQCKAVLSLIGLGRGEIADLVRDRLDDKVVAEVLPKMTPATTLSEAYDWTSAAALDLVW